MSNKQLVFSCKPRIENICILTPYGKRLIHGTWINSSPKREQRFKWQYIKRRTEFGEIRKREISLMMRGPSPRERLRNIRESLDRLFSQSIY